MSQFCTKKLLLFFALLQPGFASEQIATLTQLEGTVKIFTHPSKTVQKETGTPQALFEKEYYQVKDAAIGDSVENGNIVRTAPGSKARVVYPNGDQINVGPGSAYRISWNQDNAQAQTKINLMYGKIRGVVEKGGPRGHLQVRTKTAVMGVRGTDFFIAQGGADAATEVSIIRGSVELTPLAPKAKPIQVNAGYSANVDLPTVRNLASSTPTAKPAPRKTTQEELIGIHQSSTIASAPTKENISPEVSKKVEVLEQKATATTLQDIKASDKQLYEKLGDKTLSVTELNNASVQKLLKEAPKAPPKRKPFKSELENIEDGAYEKYFKKITD